MSTTVDGVLYTKIGTKEACVGYESKTTPAVPTSAVGEINIASNVLIDGVSCIVTMLGFCAFSGCTKLTNIVIPNTLKTLKFCCFDRLYLTEPLILPSSITKVESDFLSNWHSKSLVFCGTKDLVMTSSFSISSYLTSVIVPMNYESDKFCTKNVVKTAATGCPIIKERIKRILTCFRKKNIYPITSFLIHLIHIS